ncbi:Putative ATP-binding protein [Giardia duodenalis]|uniref:Schlafen AlbA-2 domain-containing protein n=2 Tax=Giardia intestinalis TaxID=5741 RepID=C6LQC8_GIAIB|nr:Hypothetical protein GL50581_952 [Giardia intestinalis ATCC 50581]ESU44059.1 Putative ATP-binding protein [Giardia intestinalis]
MDRHRLRPLPESLRYNDLIDFDEDEKTEFKELNKTDKPIAKIKDHCRKYLNGFINLHGGYIFFGVDDKKRIRGLMISDNNKDLICRLVSEIVNCMIPPVDAGLNTTEFIPVQEEVEQILTSNPYLDLNLDSEKEKISRYVIAVSILPGDAPIYFTTAASQSAYIRDGSRTLAMSNDDIIRRITFGRQPYFTVTSYAPSKFHYISRTSSPELLNYCLEHLRKGPITRKELILAAIDFLIAKKANIKTSDTKVIIFYGQEFITKAQLGEELCDVITTNKEQFPAIYRKYYIDLKGSTNEPLSLKNALIEIVHLIASSIDQSIIISTQSSVVNSINGNTTIPSLDQSSSTASTIEETINTMSYDKHQSTSCVYPSTYRNQTPSRDVQLVSGSSTAESLELKKPGLTLFLQTNLFNDCSKKLVSQISVALLRTVYIDLLHEVNNRGEIILLHLGDIGNKSILDGLLPTDVQAVVVATYSSQLDKFESPLEYKLLYVSPPLLQES